MAITGYNFKLPIAASSTDWTLVETWEVPDSSPNSFGALAGWADEGNFEIGVSQSLDSEHWNQIQPFFRVPDENGQSVVLTDLERIPPGFIRFYARVSPASAGSAARWGFSFPEPPTTGTFSITYEGDTTPDLPFDAGWNDIEDAINALPGIVADGGGTLAGDYQFTWNTVGARTEPTFNNSTPASYTAGWVDDASGADPTPQVDGVGTLHVVVVF